MELNHFSVLGGNTTVTANMQHLIPQQNANGLVISWLVQSTVSRNKAKIIAELTITLSILPIHHRL